VTIDVDPVIGNVGALEFRWYGLIMAVAVVVGVWIMSRQLKLRKIAPEHALGIAIIGVPCGILGARFVHILDNLGYYIENPGKIIGLQLVGLAIYGVVGGGLIGLLIYCRWRKLPVARVIDSTALAFPAAQIIGKCANIINGDTWGYATDLPWGITYTNPDSFIPDALRGVATHPTPMYEQIWLAVVIVVLVLTMRRLMKVDGLAILAYVWLYSLGRFFITFYRANDPMLGGLKEAQLIALAALVLAPALAYWLIRRQRKRKPGSSVGSKASGGKAGKVKTDRRTATGPTSKADKPRTATGPENKGKVRKFRVRKALADRFTARRPGRAE
jgi:phosphatidylglycerol:prolipoprotein diacylglycerol transferase